MNELEKNILEECWDFALELKDCSRQIIVSEFATDNFKIETKQDDSFVTSIDKGIEKILREKILKNYPDHGIIGEEFGEINSDADFVWTLDPIDGTEELVNGLPFYGTIIALLYKQTPVLGLIDHPALDICTIGAKGLGVFSNDNEIKINSESPKNPRIYLGSKHQFLRGKDDTKIFDTVSDLYPNVRIFCTCYGFTGILNGQADVALEYNLKIWDLAAVEILVNEAGGQFVKFGEQVLPNGLKYFGAIFGKPIHVENIVSTLKKNDLFL
jgi:fructose-1,6-bisphosphatase/inositol monophosphatase family enzyme